MKKRRISSTVVEMAILFVLVSVFVKGILSSSLPYETPPDGLECDHNYRIEVIHNNSIINNTLTPNGHFSAITVIVETFSQQFILDLELNRHLFAANFVQKAVTRNGQSIYHNVNHTGGHCFYVGGVRNHPGSAAAVSTCYGIVGYFAIGNVSYHIIPRSNDLRGPHVVCRGGPDAETNFRCGHDRGSFDKLLNSLKRERRIKRSFQWPQDLDKRDKVVELYVANDRSQYVAKGSNVNAVFQRTKDIANMASVTYQSLGIYIVLVGVEVWTDMDRISVNASNSTATLDKWAAYRMALINPVHYNDVAVLLSNTSYEKTGDFTRLGLAFTGAMCSNALSAALVADIFSTPSVAGTIMSHEIGHVFNLIHDDDYVQDIGPCPCSDPTGFCVMYSATFSASPSKTWSQCSKDELATSFQHGLDICLYNVPQTIYQPTQICGNGIVEDGEQCDCGNSTSQECNKACCDPVSCHLIAPATCAYGRCCNIRTCQILPSGTTCRQKAGDCDLAEICTGQTPLCPVDTHKPDGTSCTVNGVTAYCYDGLCNSRESQCELLWGPGTLVSDDACFSLFNVNGVYYGNCGVNWLPNVTYKKCQASNALCGLLHCQNNSRQLYHYQQYYLIAISSIGDKTCHTVIFDFGLQVQDPGLVPNGASCGTGRMCLNQACVDVSTVSTTPCQTTCQQNETCNNVGECQSTREDIFSSTTEPASEPDTTTVNSLNTAAKMPSIFPTIILLPILYVHLFL